MQRFFHNVVCLATGLWPLPKRVVHTVRSSASSQMPVCPLFRNIILLLPKFSHFCPPIYLSFNISFQKAVPTQDVSNSVSVPWRFCM